LVPWLAPGEAAGGPDASWLAQWLPQTVLARAFAVFLLANVIHLWAEPGSADSGGKTRPAHEGTAD
jgi:uncharacterized membrane protein YfcA